FCDLAVSAIEGGGRLGDRLEQFGGNGRGGQRIGRAADGVETHGQELDPVVVEVSRATGRMKVLATGDHLTASSLIFCSVASSASPSSEMFARTVVMPSSFSGSRSPTPQTAEMSISPSSSISIFVSVTPRWLAMAWIPTLMHDPSAPRAYSVGFGAWSSPRRGCGSEMRNGLWSRAKLRLRNPDSVTDFTEIFLWPI